MIMQALSYFVRPCPVCGRPLRILVEDEGKDVTCQHCRGRFTASDSDASRDETEQRVQRVLARADRDWASSSGRFERPCRHAAACDRDDAPDSSPCTSDGTAGCTAGGHMAPLARGRLKSRPGRETPIALVVESRDDVFDRLAAAVAPAGFRVVRARRGFEAMVQYLMVRPDLVVVDVELPGQSGWLLAAKLNLTSRKPRIWFYKTWKLPADVAMARFVQAEELLEYRGDLQVLSDIVLCCLAVRCADTPWISRGNACTPATGVGA